MAYPYSINFVGITCLIKQSATDYLVALPDGRNYHDPCSQAILDDHLPFLIIPIGQLVSSDVAGRVINRCFIIDLEKLTSLEFASATTAGPINDDDTVKHANGYLWSEIDPNFKVDMITPANTILTMKLKQGTFYARRLIGDEQLYDLAVFTEVQIDRMLPGPFDILIDGEKVNVAEGAELVVANVEPEWLVDVKADAATHFNLYYRMAINQVPCKAPTTKTPSFTTSNHPYLTTFRGLEIACSSTTYP